VGEKDVVRRPERQRHLDAVRIVGKPVDPSAAEPALQLPHVPGGELRPLEHEDDVRRGAPEQGAEPGGERASDNRVEAAPPFLTAPHLASQRPERGGQREPTPVIATIERRDQDHPQAGERGRGRGGTHTIT
jgi:hypothetical protein